MHVLGVSPWMHKNNDSCEASIPTGDWKAVFVEVDVEGFEIAQPGWPEFQRQHRDPMQPRGTLQY